MNILMVGHSRSGKTSYMAGLYCQYGNKVQQFGLWMADENKKSNLQRIGTNISHGIYPSGTDIATEYNFWLQYNNELLIPFNWYDYRGGALTETSINSNDAARLFEQMNSADALIVFLDGEKITSMTDDDLEDEYDVLLWAIQKTIAKRSSEGTYYPISFVITKGDLYNDPMLLYNSPGVEYFLPIIKTIMESNNCAGMIEIVEVSKKGIRNIFPPLIFSLYYGTPHYLNELGGKFNVEYEKFQNYDPGFFDDVFSFLDGVPSDRELQRKSLIKLQEQKEKIDKLLSKSEEMEKYLNEQAALDNIILFNPISK